MGAPLARWCGLGVQHREDFQDVISNLEEIEWGHCKKLNGGSVPRWCGLDVHTGRISKMSLRTWKTMGAPCLPRWCGLGVHTGGISKMSLRTWKKLNGGSVPR